MKKLIILLCFGLLPMIAGAPPNSIITIESKPPIEPYKALLEATAWVESSNNVNALNRKEQAFGIYQIRKIRIDDYNRRTGKSYTLQDCYNKRVSDEIYLYYASKFHFSDYKTISKAWNGSGEMTKEYWRKIKKQLNSKKD